MSETVHPMRLLREADRAEREGRPDEAVRHVRAYLDQRPYSPAIRNRLAGLLERQGDLAGALEAWSLAASRYAQDGFQHKAIAVWRRAARAHPNEAEPRRRLAELYALLGHTVEARDEFQAAIDICLRRGRRLDAARLLERKLAVADDARERLALARLELREGRAEEAAGHAERAVELARQEGGGEALAEALELLSASRPGSWQTRVELARMMLDPQPGRTLELLAAAPDQAVVRALRGRALLALGRAAEAEQCLAGCSDEEGRRTLMRARLAQGRSQEALAAVSGLVDQLLEAHRLAPAAELLEELLAGAPALVAALLRLARVRQLEGDHARLAEVYGRLATAHRVAGDETLARAAEALATAADDAAQRPPGRTAPAPGDVTAITAALVSEADLERGAEALRGAVALVIAAGVELEAAFGAPDLGRTEDLWTAFPAYRGTELTYAELARADLFLARPDLAWGFFARRREVARACESRRGLELLRRWAGRAPAGAFVVTSLVEGQFGRAGFDPARVVECRGSLEWLQCAQDCGAPPWQAPVGLPAVDPETLLAAPPYPTCGRCGALARPNVLLLGDWAWSLDRVSRQDERLQAWLARQRDQGVRPVVLECGETPRLPVLRTYVRRLVRDLEPVVVSLGPTVAGEPGVVGLALPVEDALQALDQRL